MTIYIILGLVLLGLMDSFIQLAADHGDRAGTLELNRFVLFRNPNCLV